MDTGSVPKMTFITGADNFGCSLKDAVVSHLRSLPDIEVEDLGTGAYYSIAAEIGRRVSDSDSESRRTLGLVSCGTGSGVTIFANKFPGTYAALCLSPGDAVNARSINNANILTLSGTSTSPERAVEILETFISTPFKSPCPASGDKDWSPEIQKFLDEALPEMAKIGSQSQSQSQQLQVKEVGVEEEEEEVDNKCALCCLASNREFVPVDIMPGGKMKILRESPTSAIVQFAGGSVEPAHHHTFGHDLVVLKGSKRVWNLTKKESYDLGIGDYLFTPAGDVHRVKYFEDTEFFIRWDGHWDIFLDEDIDAARAAVDI